MAGSVYSYNLYSVTQTDTSSWEITDLAPEGYKAVIRDIFLTIPGDNPYLGLSGFRIYRADSLAPIWGMSPPDVTAGRYYRFQGHIVIEQLEAVQVVLPVGNASLDISGFRLTLP
jgi:hypothetical protein